MKRIKTAMLGLSESDIKQEFVIYDAGYHRQSTLVGIGKRGLRIRYPNGTDSKINFLTNATQDLNSLGALLITGLVPAGVFADKLQEEFPQHEEAANLLREWEQIKTHE